jgi:hypothetical protein
VENWETIGRPGYFGKNRDQKYKEWDEKYVPGNWRIVWKMKNIFVPWIGACALYEDAYFYYLKRKPDFLEILIKEASNVYDDEITNVESGFDYTKQETQRTHMQDIAIRRSLIRMGCWFQGNKLIRIRQELGTHPLSIALSPGRVPFHKPELIEKPALKRWWHPGTIEAFYQSNKFLQIKKQ